MRYVLVLMGLYLFVHADRLAVQTMGCEKSAVFEMMDDGVRTDAQRLQMFANRHGCVILSTTDKIQVITPNPASSAGHYFQVLLERSGQNLHVPKKAVILEQPGNKNRFTF